jgi:hypothetical protein
MNGKTSLVFHRLLAATLLVSGLGAIAAPAFAEGTAAGTSIDNTATATYEDPAGATFNATSNTVKVTVAEVAGVTVTPLSTIDRNGGNIGIGDIVDYEFKVTNVGNDTTGFYIPNTASVTGPATAAPVQIVAYIAPDGTRTALTTAITIAGPGGQNTTALSSLVIPTAPAAGVIPAGYSLVVNVPTTIKNLASSGSSVTVQLGNTGLNDNSAATQNQPAPTAATDLIRTVDYAGEANGLLSQSQEKQASATQAVKVGSTSQALATILKTRTSYSANDVSRLNDDVIGYDLALKVESAAPAGSVGVTPGKLVGTDITIDGSLVNRVLISDAIPLSTSLTTTASDLRTPGSNWIPIYTYDSLATSAITAKWSVTRDPAKVVTRIGFVYDATLPANALAQGSNSTGFGFRVITNGVPAGATTATILSIAQVFGQTQGNTGPTAPLVYDESGDKSPSNFNDNGTPGTTATLTPSSATIPSGSPDATNDGIDNNNDNTGQGPGGEDNVITITIPGTILNGPNGIPGAVGPTNSNDDFTNLSSPIPPNTLPNTTITPAPVIFTNTLSNPSTSASLANVLLVPDLAGFIAGPGEQIPPNGTIVTLTYGTSTAVYKYDPTPIGSTYPNGTFILQPGSGSIIIPTLAAGQAVNYTVSVALPPATPLSTDTGNGFSVPVFAFIDGTTGPGANDSRPSAGEVQNRTIDRVYTGFLQLVKAARVLDKDGATVLQDWTQNSALLSGKGEKDRFIEYRISYKNISIAPTGTGNLTLDAKNISITEDGVNGGNSWAKDTDANGVIDTSHVIGSVSVTYGGLGSVIFSPSGEQTGTTAATDVTKYVHSPGVVIQPQANGTFIFKRKIN